ncbi:PadR family transcriptional regulator [Nocardia callitridis]|uniref:Transcription regulator PadR N-terminal domain-containing protein n=1 Tax=Nocardia callitridis TaxID=648753 RepID=A0ABP9K946_9NOCA
MEYQENRGFGRPGRWQKPGEEEFNARREFRRGGRHGHGRPHDFGPGFGPGFGPQFGRGRGRGGRGRRGDVRAAVLLLLTEGPMHGYQLIQKIKERSDDIWRPSPGSIYPALAQLEDEGLILIEKVAGRKTAELTAAGTEYVTEHRDELGDPWAEVKEDVGAQAIDLRGVVGQLMGAVTQVASAGTAEQAKRAAELLTETRKSLYRILSEDAPEK